MKILYHIKDLNPMEKSEVQGMIDHHVRTYHFAEKHYDENGHENSVSMDVKIDKTNERPGHCKYTMNFHLHTPPNSEHVLKKEGFDLIALMKETLSAMDHHMIHIVERSKKNWKKADKPGLRFP